MIFVAIVWLLLCLLVGKFAALKGRSAINGFGLSFVCSPLVGFLVVALLRDNAAEIVARHSQAMLAGSKRCPYCAEMIQAAAILCRHCGRQLAGTGAQTRASSRQEIRFYYGDNGTTEGPFTAAEIRNFLDAGLIDEATPIVKEGESKWRWVHDYPVLASAS